MPKGGTKTIVAQAAPRMADAKDAPTNRREDELLWRWLRSPAPTPKAFAKLCDVEWARLRRTSRGWLARRRRLDSGTEPPLAPEAARVRMAVLWWDIVWRVGAELDATKENESELKRLTQLASVLKTAQASLEGMGAFCKDSENPPVWPEGFDVDAL